ncbi:MAG TPA: aldehyde dehydrogenase (NADP(+)) [Flavilitoribacter sp.]|nr:aldehyde dehydrogenase (NADP(+)) [Flavilitoribacter sp.]HMQ87185.1 aldehyde dehydrogenase (NADP(+)) [Flavilitoribacter sp.]
MAELGKNLIGFEWSSQGKAVLKAVNPKGLAELEGEFYTSTETEVDRAMEKAHNAWLTYRNAGGKAKGAFLRAIADEIEALGDTLIERVMQESGLPQARVTGERGRTCGQLRLFAQLVEEGSWIEAIVDTAIPDRQPAPKPDIRRMLTAIGPVVVFTASNFPLAFSTAGGDTASALAAGCPVVVKAHESHLGTNALIAGAIRKAAETAGMPDGVFSSLNGAGYQTGQLLVEHPLTKAVAFTGSLRGGKALYDLAAKRPEPIPVFAEMGSVNPVVFLPDYLTKNSEKAAQNLAGSVNLGVGQFCTNPGLVFVLDHTGLPDFLVALKTAFAGSTPGTMLNPGIHRNFEFRKMGLLKETAVVTEFEWAGDADETQLQARQAFASVTGQDFIQNPHLHEEIFGPFTLVVRCADPQELTNAVTALSGQLTASIWGETGELNRHTGLIDVLQSKVGRLIFNGMPTGVEVCHAMQHGGPYPATTDSRFTSVGTTSIKRFARPVAYQDCPDEILPAELKQDNPLGIWRTLDGALSKNKG